MKLSRFSPFLIILMLAALSVGIVSNISTAIPDASAAFGASPPWVRNDHILPGATFEQVINVSRSEVEHDMQLVTKISGDKKLLKWIKIPDKKELIIKEGEKMLPMKVIIDVPKRAALKNYTGSIYVTLSSVEEDDALGSGQVAIALGGNIDVNITVIGDKVVDYRVQNISVDRIDEGNPFYVNINAKNLGNTEISNIEGQVDIYNKAGIDVIASSTFIPLADPLLPDEDKKITMIFDDIVLDPGEYWVNVKTFKDGEIFYENRLFQEVNARVVPVVASNDADSEKPALPGAADEAVVASPDTQISDSDLRPAATPVAPATPGTTEATSIFLIFGLAGLAFGFIALIGIIVVLIVVLKNQRQPVQATPPIQTAPPVQPAPPVQAPPQVAPPVAPPVQAPPNEPTADDSLGEG